MHQPDVAANPRRKTHLARGMLLLASLFAAASVAAQTPQTWKSHLSPDEPEAIYRQHCATCHGPDGDGKTMAQYALDPPPKDFTAAKTRRESSRAHMIEVLNRGAVTKDGKPTAMIAWKKHLSREQIEAVVDYIIVKYMEGKLPQTDPIDAQGHQHKGHDHSKVSVKTVNYPYGLKANASRGQSVYTANCQACHGANGDGKGDPARVKQSRPRNFHDADFAEFANGFSLFSAISRGRGHMPAWDKALAKQDIADVSEYVLRTFVKPAEDESHEHHHHAK